MQIDKLKTYAEGIYLEYSSETPAGVNKFTMDCRQRALPELYSKRNQLTDHVCELMDLPDDWSHTMEIRSISFRYFDDNPKGKVFGVVITAIRKLKSGLTVILNTPFSTDIPLGNSTNYDACLSEVCVKVLHALQAEAIKYINGERAQMELFKEESTKERRNRKTKERKVANG